MSLLTDIALGWARVGVFGFGGGPGMIPLMQAECVQANGWLTDEQFLEAIAASSALPGPIAVKMSVLVGAQVAGVPGAMAAFVGVTVPAVALISLLAGALMQFRATPAVSGAMRAVQPAVVGLLAWTVVSLAPDGIRSWSGALIAGGALAALAFKLHPAVVIVSAMIIGAVFMR